MSRVIVEVQQEAGVVHILVSRLWILRLASSPSSIPDSSISTFLWNSCRRERERETEGPPHNLINQDTYREDGVRFAGDAGKSTTAIFNFHDCMEFSRPIGCQTQHEGMIRDTLEKVFELFTLPCRYWIHLANSRRASSLPADQSLHLNLLWKSQGNNPGSL